LEQWRPGSSRLKKFLEWAWGEDVDLNMPQFFGKICRKSIKPFSKAGAKKSKIVDKISDKIEVLKRDGIKIVLVENNL
jgi:hypothetical protein